MRQNIFKDFVFYNEIPGKKMNTIEERMIWELFFKNRD